jgi:hypothetical protein
MTATPSYYLSRNLLFIQQRPAVCLESPTQVNEVAP